MGKKVKLQTSDKKLVKISLSQVVIFVATIWIVSLVAVWFIAQNEFSTRESTFPFLNPRLETYGLDTPEDRNAKLFVTLTPLKDKLLEYLGDNKENVAFYVEDLNTGSWAGWKERDPFIPASLLKVPVAIGVMKKIDKGEWNLDETLLVVESRYKDGYFGDLWKVEDGTELTVRKLLVEMLQNSDNTAANLFFDKLSKSEREDVYYHIGMVNPEVQSEDTTSGPLFTNLASKDLATMFRALFNSTYLTRKSSNYILETLTETKFDKVLSTTIPEDVKVAHKIGNFYNKDPNRPKDYHDCGIAFLPEHPYLYCIMTQNLNPEVAEPLITGFSNNIYTYFEKAGQK